MPHEKWSQQWEGLLMKSLTVVLMLLALAVFSSAFAGCGGGDGSSTEEPTTEKPAE